MILSRVAETIYWMARYLERAENTARIIMVNANLLMDLPKGIAPGWEPILAITGSKDLYYGQYSELSERNVVRFMVSDKANSGSLLNSLARARENMRTTRVIFPRGAWESINDLYYFADEHKARGLSCHGRYDYLTHIIRSCQLVAGNISGAMSHDQTYEFVRLGMNLERADMTTRVLEVRAGNLLPRVGEGLQPFDDIQWKSILESLAAYQMYRRHVHVGVTGSAVLGYLLHDKEFPRAISYCLAEAQSSLRALPVNDMGLRMLGATQRFISELSVKKLDSEDLDKCMGELQLMLAQVHEQVAGAYFQTERLKNQTCPIPEGVDVSRERVG